MNFISKAWAWVKSTVSSIFNIAVKKPIEVLVVKPAKAIWKSEKLHRFRFTKLIAAVVVPFVGARAFNRWNAGRLGLLEAGLSWKDAVAKIGELDLAGLPLSPAQAAYQKQGFFAVVGSLLASVLGIMAA